MEREHLIIIALILVALYMMNNSSKDKVAGIGPAGRIRYEGCTPGVDCPLPFGHIHTRREGFYGDGAPDAEAGTFGQRIRLGDKDFSKGHFVKHHIRHNNRNNMFSGMMGDDFPQDSAGIAQDIRGFWY